MSEFNGDYLRKPQSGEKLHRLFSARLISEVIDTVRYVRGLRTGDTPPLLFGGASQTVALVRNDSGADRDRFGVLGIAEPRITPTDNLNDFLNRPLLSGVTPTADHQDRFVILLEPLAAGQIGRAALAGLAVARVAVTTATAGLKQVRAQTGDSVALALASQGAQLLWREGGGDGVTEWALIRFGGTQGGVASTVGVPPGESVPIEGELITLPGGSIKIGPGGELIINGTPENPGLITFPLFPPLLPAPGNVWIAGGSIWFVDGDGGEHELRPDDIPDANPDPFQVWWAAPGADPDNDPGVPEWKGDPAIIALGLRGSNGQEIYQSADSPDEGGWSFYWPNAAPTEERQYLASGPAPGVGGGYHSLLWRGAMEGATAEAAGQRGLVPAPAAGDQNKVLKGDGTWGTVTAGGGGGNAVWRKYEFSYEAFEVINETEVTLTIETLGPTEVLHWAYLTYTDPFVGGFIETTEVVLGFLPGNLGFFISESNVFPAITHPSGQQKVGTIFAPGAPFWLQQEGGNGEIALTMTVTGNGATLDQLTTGMLQVYLQVSDLEGT